MPKKIRDKWVKALRSGEYGQCRSKLTDGKGNFCCLGVLQHCTSGGKVGAYSSTGNFMSLPTGDWYASKGITCTGEYVFVEMNDGIAQFDNTNRLRRRRRKNFNQIADYIEKNVEVY